jgi:hypothetical protein
VRELSPKELNPGKPVLGPFGWEWLAQEWDESRKDYIVRMWVFDRKEPPCRLLGELRHLPCHIPGAVRLVQFIPWSKETP